MSLREYVVNSVVALPSVGLRFEVSPLDPRVYFLYKGSGSAVGVFATHIVDILGGGEPDISAEARNSLGASFGKLKVQGGSFVHVGMELAQGKDSSGTSTRADFTKNMKLLPTPP